MSKTTLLKGTLILTLAGFTTRFIGFFYRIYLSNALGAKNMGVYQLVFPIYGICFTLYASGIQTSISKLVAAEVGDSRQTNSKNIHRILLVGLFCSVSIALILSLFVFYNAQQIASGFLFEPSCAGSLRVLALVFPFCGITACINGYYYGLKRAGIPATTQLLEQIVRVISVYALAGFIGKGNSALTCELAVLGVVIGEIFSNIYNLLSLLILPHKKKNREIIPASNRSIFKKLIKLVVPLTGNRLLISVLNSVEAVLIPVMLRKSGLDNNESLSIYGILTGMAIPFILFPSTITNSFAVLLLPTVSEAQAEKNDALISRTATMSIKYSLIIGILSAGIFIIFGNALGNTVFHNQMAGDFVTTLAWLCPFIYLTTTLGSIINGLGKAHLTFFNTVVGLSIRILFVLYVVPKEGISGYLTGLLVSQLVISALDTFAVMRNIKVSINAVDWLLKPGLIIAFIGFLIMKTYHFLASTIVDGKILLLLASCFMLCVIYVVLLFLTKALSLKEIRG